MPRQHNTRRDGQRFSQEIIDAVWAKGHLASSGLPGQTRTDVCGALMIRDSYGDTRNLGYGWEIDHIIPVSAGGSDDLTNLQPLQWENNRHKGDKHPWRAGDCRVTASGTANRYCG